MKSKDYKKCENLLSLHPFPSSQEENVDEVTEETVVSKKLTQSLITSQVMFLLLITSRIAIRLFSFN